MKCKALIDKKISLTKTGKVRGGAVVSYGTVTIDWDRLCSHGTKKQTERWQRLRDGDAVPCGGELQVSIIEANTCCDYEPSEIDITCLRCGSPQGQLDEEEAERVLTDYIRNKEN